MKGLMVCFLDSCLEVLRQEIHRRPNIFESGLSSFSRFCDIIKGPKKIANVLEYHLILTVELESRFFSIGCVFGDGKPRVPPGHVDFEGAAIGPGSLRIEKHYVAPYNF